MPPLPTSNISGSTKKDKVGEMFRCFKIKAVLVSSDNVFISYTILPFHPPGPAYDAHLSFISAIVVMLHDKEIKTQSTQQ